MTRRVVLERHAEEDLDEQAVFIARDNPAEALAFLDAVEQAFSRLVDYPDVGSARAFRHTRLEGNHMWPVPECPNWLIFYRVTEDVIQVLRILHAAQDYDGRGEGRARLAGPHGRVEGGSPDITKSGQEPKESAK